jgi:hypothetical protein
LENDAIFYDNLGYFKAIWYNLWPFVVVCGHLIFFPVLVYLEKKNLATLVCL